jgi:hypothetical protein
MECEPTDQTEPYCCFVVVVGEPSNILNLLFIYATDLGGGLYLMCLLMALQFTVCNKKRIS